MKSKLTKNLGLKIVSVLVGILIWLVVVNIDNPVIVRSFTLSNVELVNEAFIDETGLVCLKENEETPVRVTVRGTTKVLKGITAEDIRLVADMQQAMSLKTDPVMIPITASCDGIAASNITVYPQNLQVTLEDKVTSEYPVAVSNTSAPGKGFEIGYQTVTPEKIRITGPESLMKIIDKVVVSPEVGGAVSDLSEESSLMVIDKNGDTLSDVAMSNLKFDTDGKVRVFTKLWKVRTDVALEAVYYGTPAVGYIVDKVTTVPATISVAGSAEALETLREQGNTLKIEDSSVDISGVSEDFEQKVNIADLLPEGLKLSSGTSDEVYVTVSVLPDGGKSFSMPTVQIEARGRQEGLQVSFEVDKVELRVKAASEDVDIDDFDISKVEAYIEVEDLKEGIYDLPVTLILPEGYELIADVTTEISISPVSIVAEDGE